MRHRRGCSGPREVRTRRGRAQGRGEGQGARDLRALGALRGAGARPAGAPDAVPRGPLQREGPGAAGFTLSPRRGSAVLRAQWLQRGGHPGRRAAGVRAGFGGAGGGRSVRSPCPSAQPGGGSPPPQPGPLGAPAGSGETRAACPSGLALRPCPRSGLERGAALIPSPVVLSADFSAR